MEEKIGKRINVERVDEALALDPDVVSTACPFCLVMLGDAVTAKKQDGEAARGRRGPRRQPAPAALARPRGHARHRVRCRRRHRGRRPGRHRLPQATGHDAHHGTTTARASPRGARAVVHHRVERPGAAATEGHRPHRSDRPGARAVPGRSGTAHFAVLPGASVRRGRRPRPRRRRPGVSRRADGALRELHVDRDGGICIESSTPRSPGAEGPNGPHRAKGPTPSSGSRWCGRRTPRPRCPRPTWPS